MSLNLIGFYQSVPMAQPWLPRPAIFPFTLPEPIVPLSWQTGLPGTPPLIPKPLSAFDSFEASELKAFEPFTNDSARPQPAPKSAQKSSKIDDWVLKRSKPLYMPEATAPLNRLARKIAVQGGIQQPFKVLVVNKPNYNAAAFSNGTIIFNVDTLKRAKSPEELAFVLAHELSHVQFDDSKARKKRYGIATATAFILEEGTNFVFRVRNILKSVALSIAAPAAAFQWFAYKERQDEARADINAIRLLSQAGFSTSGHRSAFENMSQDVGKANWWMHLQWKIFGADHPALPKRLQAVELAVRQSPIAEFYNPCMSLQEWQGLKTAASRVTATKKCARHNPTA